MSTKVKGNNKGFSLVELIVVMAIMAILAVTLAPRLSSYVEKARQASDKEVVNSIYTAVKYAILDDATRDEAITLTDIGGTGYLLNDGSTTDHTSLYEVTGKDWEFDTSTTASNKLLDEIKSVVGEFKLKSDNAKDTSQILIRITGTGSALDVAVELQYTAGTTAYTADDNAVRP